MTNCQGLLALSATCEGGHEHLPWSSTVVGSGERHFASSEEAVYPKQLCAAIVNCIFQGQDAQVHDGSTIPDAPARADLARIRVGVGGLPRGRRIGAIVPEFESYRTIWCRPDDKFLDLDDGARGRTLRSSGAEGVRSDGKVKMVVGVFADPLTFFEKAKRALHPMQYHFSCRSALKEAISDTFACKPSDTIKLRMESLKWLKQEAARLQPAEDLLHDSMSSNIKRVCEGKRLLLFDSFVSHTLGVCPGIAEAFRKGFNITGWVEPSGLFEKDLKPMEYTKSMLLDQAIWKEKADSARKGPSDDYDVLRAACDKEVAAGWLEGPLTSLQLDGLFGQGRWKSSLRFGVRQGLKVRPVDDYSASGVNAPSV